MKKLLLGFATAITAFAGVAADVTITDADLGNGEYTWTKDNVYLLDGFVFLEAGGKLTIEAGTVIKGKATPTSGDNASALIITAGAQIFANGTASEPIIFTAEVDDLNGSTTYEDRGLWGGLIILGNGVLGVENADGISNVEGIPTEETRAVYGGTNDADNSGIIRYISIRHGGAELSPGDEINGLTLAGVGSGTTIEHVEVFANSDDGIEFFGGAVGIKWAVVASCGDDCFDFDSGWRGKGQFWFAFQTADAGDACGEFDGASPDNNPRFSKPELYNLSFVGGGVSPSGAKSSYGMLIRDGAAGTFANSIFTEIAGFGIEIEDRASDKGVDSRSYLESGDLKVMNNIFFAFGGGKDQISVGSNGIVKATDDAEELDAATIVANLVANGNTIENPNIKSISRTENGMLDPRVFEGAAFNNLANYPSDNFFTAVGYKGAFGDFNWAYGWTALSDQGFMSNTTATTTVTAADVTIFPNPASSTLTVKAENGSDVVLMTISGQTVESKISNGNTVFNVSHLTAGVYLIKVTKGSEVAVEKVIIK